MSQTTESPPSLASPATPDMAGNEAAFPVRISWPTTWVVLTSLTAFLASMLVFASGGNRGFFLPLLAAAVCLLAAIFDGCTGRIPNPLTYTAILVGLALNAAVALLALLGQETAITWLGAPGLAQCLLGFGACTVLWILASLMGGAVHGGDLKLLVALGALLGLSQTGGILILALAVAIVYSLINLAVFGHLNRAVRIATQRLLELFFLRRFHTPLPDDPAIASASHIPMAVPLAIGLLLAYYWQWRTGGRLL